jgi:sugar transferase (PEP-CTERM/EpsH1 system associated)
MKILVVLPRFPHPLDKGDKLRAFHQIRCLSQKHEVYLFCTSHQWVNDDDFNAVKSICKDIEVVHPNTIVSAWNVLKAALSARSLQVAYWTSKKTVKKFRKFEKKVQPDVLYCQMIRTMKWVKKSKNPKVLDFQDALSKNIERRMYHSGCFWRKVLHYEFKMVRSCEYDAFDIFDAFTIISAPDRDVIPHRRSSEIVVLPNGIDTDYFKPIDIPKNYDVVFCGNMNYPPNVDAAKHLVKDIMPKVWEKHPEARVLISGTNPAGEVKRLAGEKITVTGRVEDIRQSYAQSKAFVAPMRMGSGMQNKLLEAMAMGLPCVTSKLAADALGTETGKHLLIGENSDDFAQKVVALLDNESHRAELADEGNRFVRDNFNWERCNDILEGVLSNALNNHK